VKGMERVNQKNAVKRSRGCPGKEKGVKWDCLEPTESPQRVTIECSSGAEESAEEPCYVVARRWKNNHRWR